MLWYENQWDEFHTPIIKESHQSFFSSLATSRLVDSYSKWIWQKCHQFFINKNWKKKVLFFTFILPNYVPHEITKEFWKNSQFENMLTGFLLRCQNSLRWEICLICHWNIDSWKQKLSLGCVMVPKSNQKSSRYSTNYI